MLVENKIKSNAGISHIILCFSFLLWPLLSYSQDINALKNQPFLTVKGEIGISTIFFSTEGRESYRSPFTYIFSGSPTISIYGIDFPVTIRVSEQERDFRQPINRIGLSPQYKWATVRAGYQSLQYSKYSLNGHAVTGYGFDLNPGKWDIRYMRGTLLNAIRPSEFMQDVDFRIEPTYRRTGQFLKLGYGTEKGKVSIVITDAQDDPLSLSQITEDIATTPAENNIISFTGEYDLMKGLSIDAEYGQSAYTNNTSSVESINSAMTSSIIGLFINPSNSTEIRSAFETNLRYRGKVFSTKINYQRVDPGYRSMGAYFFLNDVEKISIDPSLRLAGGKVSVNGSIGFQKNNLNNTKSRETTRNIGSMRLQFRPINNYNVTLSYSNFGIAQSTLRTSTTPDQDISQVTNNIGINQSFQWINKSYMHNALLNIQKQSLNDQNPESAVFTDYDNITLFGTYSFNYLPTKTGITATYTYSSFENNTFSTTFSGPNLSLQQSVWGNKVRLSLAQSFLSNERDELLVRKIRKTTLRIGLKLSKSHRINIRSHYNKSESFDNRSTPFSELKTELNYAYRIQ